MMTLYNLHVHCPHPYTNPDEVWRGTTCQKVRINDDDELMMMMMIMTNDGDDNDR